jgi:hypothetical protein
VALLDRRAQRLPGKAMLASVARSFGAFVRRVGNSRLSELALA